MSGLNLNSNSNLHTHTHALNSNPNLINDGGITFDNPVALSEVDRGGGESSDSVESDEGESESVENNGE